MSFRKLTSIFLGICFFILIFSGVILFIMPYGRVAYWTDWRFLGLNKDQWSEIHIVFSIGFFTTGFTHIFFNIKPLLFYLKKAKIEVFYTFLFTIFLLIGSIWNFKPFSILINFEENVKNSWIDNKIAPKIPHGELWSLKKLIKRMNINEEKALEALKDKGIKILSIKEKIKDIGKRNGVKPVVIYQILNNIKAKKNEKNN